MTFWLFQIPNSLLPQHEYRDANYSKDKKKKRKKDKDSDAEDEGNITLLEPDKIENIKENDTGTIVTPASDEESHAANPNDIQAEDNVTSKHELERKK